MSDDLVKRICQMWIADGRAKDCFWEGWPECPTPEHSLTPRMVLDRIEELEASNRGLVRLNEATEARAKTAEAKLAKAVDALELLHDNVVQAWPTLANLGPVAKARATLAEINGGQP